jgi:hypothetical protein
VGRLKNKCVEFQRLDTGGILAFKDGRLSVIARARYPTCD